MKIVLMMLESGIRILTYCTKKIKDLKIIRLDRKWNLLFKEDNKFVSKLNDSLFIYHYQDSVLSRLVYNSFEEAEISFIRNYLKTSDVFIDIGANIGLFSLHAAQIVGKSGKVHAFEPTPVTFSRLEQNINLNNFNDIIKSNNIGISDEKDNLKLNISLDGHDAWNTFANASDVPFEKQLIIPVDTLDSYLNRSNIKPESIALIKIDVEGWEVAVINGAIETLNGQNSPVLLIEFSENNLFAANTCSFMLYDIVTSLGYRWYTYDSINNCLIPEQKRQHYYYNNLIAIKNLELAQTRLSK